MSATELKRRVFTEKQLKRLTMLLAFSGRYEINIQFWPDQTAVYIYKGGVELTSYGGDFDFAIVNSLKYLRRINGIKSNRS